MRTIRDVSAGLDLIAERKKSYPELGKFLDLLDDIDNVVGHEEDHAQDAPVNRPFSGEELQTAECWK